jgi:hypothetical protein
VSGKLRRRGVLAGLVSLPALGFARPQDLLQKKAVFEEIASSVQMTLSLPALIRKSDKEALQSIDSGFDSTLRFEIDVWAHGVRATKIASRTVIVKVGKDPWTDKYAVKTQGNTGWIRRTFTTRDAAVEAAVTLDRIRICDSALLTRGTGDDGPYYFCTVLAMRNPVKEPVPGRRRRRGGDRDLEWFGRLVDALAGERARAEEIVNVKTNPFYLPS